MHHPTRRSALPALLVLSSLVSAGTAEGAIIASQKKSTPFPGVTLIEGRTRAPASNFKASVISLCTKGIRVDATAAPTSFRTVPSWAASVGAKVAVNGDFYVAGPRVYGVAVGGGKAWPIARTGVDPAVNDQWYYERFGWIAFGKDWVEFNHTRWVKANAAKIGATSNEGFSPAQVSHQIPKGTLALVSGFPELVTEGKRYACASPTATACFPDRGDMRARHPRTAMGLSQDRRTLFFAVVDGRSVTSAGMYGTELAELMEELGAWQAFNLDGGGSTTMWMSGRGTINQPSDGSPRAVANHWGVFTSADPAAHCMPLPEPDPEPAPGAGEDGDVDGGADLPDDVLPGADAPTSPPDGPSDGAEVAAMGDDGPESGCAVAAPGTGAALSWVSLLGLFGVIAARASGRRRRTRP